MKLIDNWLHVLKHAWSVRWNLVATAMGSLPLLLDGMDNFIAPMVFVKLMVVANIAAFASRFVKQESPDA